MLGATLLLVAVTAQVVLGTPIQSRTAYAVKGAHPVPRQWKRVARAPKSQMIRLQIGVKQGQFDELERHLYEGMYLILAFASSVCSNECAVSDPEHERYGDVSTPDVCFPHCSLTPT